MSEANVSTEQPQASEEARLPPPHVDPRGKGDHQGPPAEGPRPPVGLIWRVDRRETFESLRRARRQRSGPLTVSWVPGEPTEPPRVADSIGRRTGPAGVRNRLRRRLRMLMREHATALRPGSYLVGAGPAAVGMAFEEMRRSLVSALGEVGGSGGRR